MWENWLSGFIPGLRFRIDIMMSVSELRLIRLGRISIIVMLS